MNDISRSQVQGAGMLDAVIRTQGSGSFRNFALDLPR
jgi:hypothetical protein